MRSIREELDVGLHRVDLFALLRALERETTDKPRIGKSEVLAQDIVRLEQEPFLDHAVSNLQKVEFPVGEAPRVSAAFLFLEKI